MRLRSVRGGEGGLRGVEGVAADNQLLLMAPRLLCMAAMTGKSLEGLHEQKRGRGNFFFGLVAMVAFTNNFTNQSATKLPAMFAMVMEIEDGWGGAWNWNVSQVLFFWEAQLRMGGNWREVRSKLLHIAHTYKAKTGWKRIRSFCSKYMHSLCEKRNDFNKI